MTHPEMTNQLEQLQETVVEPAIISQDHVRPSIHYYFRYYKNRGEHLCVAVKYLNGDGFIMTAFYTDRIP